MKVAAGFVGPVGMLKKLIDWNVIDLQLKSTIPIKHPLNHHPYMERGLKERRDKDGYCNYIV